MRKFLVQVGVIVMASLVLGMVYNQFLESPLPILKTYKPDPTREIGEDLSVYYSEIDADGLKGMMEANMAVLLDARTRENFNKAHIPLAVSLPISEFKQTYADVSPLLTGDIAIIIYCIGLDCIDSALLAKELHQKGHQDIFVYKGGIEDWQALGYPLARGENAEGGYSHE